MKLLTERLAEKHGMRFVLEQTPAESTAHRFAKLDLRYHSPASGHAVKGDISKGTVYYTNSTYIPVSAPIGPISRVRTEGLFHPMIEAGSLTHIWLGEAEPSAESVASFVEKVFRNTKNDQVALSPEFTACEGCGKTMRGLHDSAPPAAGRTWKASPAHRVFHEALLLEQRQAGRAEGPLQEPAVPQERGAVRPETVLAAE